MAANRPPGRILTFYSYKGGTGRSMALANIAWILASSGRRVLMIDWDLEAPGLHRYFRPFLIDEELSASDGLMDMVDNYASQAIRPLNKEAPPDPNWYLEYADFSDYVISINFERFPSGGKIDLLPAGRQNDHYAIMVSSFNWQNFYDRLGGGGFFEAVKANARAQYDYILIDSRTGVSDTAGICSVQMPDSLVVCFTYNNQSIKGAAAVVRSAIARRAHLEEEQRATRRALPPNSAAHAVEDTPPPYRIFPVPMRVESGESDRLAIRQAFARQCFDGLIDHIGPSEIGDYWGAVEIPHKAFYAYEEVLAPFKEDALDPKTVLAAFVRLTRKIADRDVDSFRHSLSPEETQAYLNRFAQTARPVPKAEARQESPEEALVRAADTALASMGEEERQAASRVFSRLVRLGRIEEGGGYFPIRAPVKDFSPEERSLVIALAGRGLLTVSSEAPRSSRSQGAFNAPSQSVEQTAGFADERLLKSWKTLIEWLDADHEFLLWRQQLRTYLSDWERNGREAGSLLSGAILREAEHWSATRGAQLNAAETAYIAESRKAYDEASQSMARADASQSTAMTIRRGRRGWAVAALLAVLVAGIAVWKNLNPSTSVAPTPLPSIVSTPLPAVIDKKTQVDGLVAQGDGYFAAGNIERAQDAYAKALGLDPQNDAASTGFQRAKAEDQYQSTVGRIVFHYVDSADGGQVNELVNVLAKTLKLRSVPAPELVVEGKTNGDVRYFFARDKMLALRIKQATEQALAANGLHLMLAILERDEREFPKASPGTVEVWLPSLKTRKASAE